jgi:hypothetical protein
MRIAACVAVSLILMIGDAWAQQGSQPGAQPGAQQGAQATQATLQGFSVVLVLGDLQGSATPDNIPAAARSALADLKDFLPYKSYRVLDSAWILGSTTQLFRATSRVRGADEQMYEISLTSSPVGAPAPSLQVKFVMHDAGDPEKTTDAAHRDAQVKAELMQLSAAKAALEKSSQSLEPNENADERRQRQRATRDKIRDIEMTISTLQNLQPVSSGQTLIDTSFNMRIGETVVVGTSRVRGDKALIALLTAVRK